MNKPYTAQTAVNSYNGTANFSEVEQASPHGLIDLMLERTLARIAAARGSLRNNDHAAKGHQIRRAVGIVDGLRAFLDVERGGALAANLDRLYEYMSRRLLEATVQDDDTILEEVSGLVREIRSAWTAIGPQNSGDIN